jgi:hypothetical protein
VAKQVGVCRRNARLFARGGRLGYRKWATGLSMASSERHDTARPATVAVDMTGWGQGTRATAELIGPEPDVAVAFDACVYHMWTAVHLLAER